MGGSEKGGQRIMILGRSLHCRHSPLKAGGCRHVQMWRGQPRALLHRKGRGSSLAILVKCCRHLEAWEWGVKMTGKLEGKKYKPVTCES